MGSRYSIALQAMHDRIKNAGTIQYSSLTKNEQKLADRLINQQRINSNYQNGDWVLS